MRIFKIKSVRVMKKPIKFNQVATFPKNLFSRDWLCFRSYPFTYGVFCTQLGLTLHAQALLKYSFDTEDYHRLSKIRLPLLDIDLPQPSLHAFVFD